jgi:hypothetical protein
VLAERFESQEKNAREQIGQIIGSGSPGSNAMS